MSPLRAAGFSWEQWLVFAITDQSSKSLTLASQLLVSPNTLPRGGGTLIIYKGLWGIYGSKIEFFKCSLSGTCSWGPLEGVFCSLSICFARIGCDIKLNRLLTGRWVGNEAARMHTHWLTDPTCYGSVVHKSEHNRSRSLPSVSLLHPLFVFNLYWWKSLGSAQIYRSNNSVNATAVSQDACRPLFPAQ